jgi:2-polyprenyl-3-methyl-5-hydroxy-6-metoxy-1,4-benzoquinol methylase
VNPTLEELQRAMAEIEERVRARHPQSALGGEVRLPDLWPLLHARDAAEGKVAAIGRVNPRPPGLVNNLIQGVKGAVARSLNWFVRDQVEFNRASMQCIEAILEALKESNRAHAELAGRLASHTELREEARELRDLRVHWSQWRQEWERKLSINEAQFMRAVADLQLAGQQRQALAEADFRDKIRMQHTDFLGALDRSAQQLQERLSADLNQMRGELQRGSESLIHQELRLLRQRPVVAVAKPVAAEEPALDWFTFADKFRGPEPKIRAHFERYLPLFSGGPVLDLGCGRGEFLRLLRDRQVTAKGLDLNEENIALCLAEGLDAELLDFFAYLPGLADCTLGGVFCSQVIEHLRPAQLPQLIRLCAAKLKPGAPILFETPNPECLAIFATHFYLDPTHVRPVPPALMEFYLAEAGFTAITVERLGTAANDFPELAGLPETFRQRFFGSLDYAVHAIRL